MQLNLHFQVILQLDLWWYSTLICDLLTAWTYESSQVIPINEIWFKLDQKIPHMVYLNDTLIHNQYIGQSFNYLKKKQKQTWNPCISHWCLRKSLTIVASVVLLLSSFISFRLMSPIFISSSNTLYKREKIHMGKS